MRRAQFWRCFRERGSRLLQLLCGMVLVISLLAVIEIVVLRMMGIQYKPTSAIHRVCVSDFTISADGRWAASRIRLFHAALNEPPEQFVLLHDMHRLDRLTRVDVGRNELQSVAISPAGDLVAISTIHGVVSLWSRHGGNASPRTIHHPIRGEVISGLTWSPDGQYLAGFNTAFICLWAVPSGDLLHTFSYTNDNGSAALFSLSFSRDSCKLLSAGQDELICLWDVAKGNLIESLRAPGPVVSALVFSDGKRVAFMVDDALYVWSVEPNREIWRKPPTPWRQKYLALSADDAFLATVEREPREDLQDINRVVIRCASTGRHVSTLDDSTIPIAGLCFCTNGTLCSWDQDGAIRGWNVQSQNEVWKISPTWAGSM